MSPAASATPVSSSASSRARFARRARRPRRSARRCGSEPGMAKHETHNPPVNEDAETRESPVRHAHAVLAERRGRAGAPGYLGLPAEEVGEVEDDQAFEDGPPDERELFGDDGE